MTRQTIIAAFILAVACGQGAAQSATLYVNATCGNDAWSGTNPECVAPDGPKATIQAGIDAAASGDQVLAGAGTYFEKINFHGKAVSLRAAEGPALTTIDAQQSGTVVTCTSEEGSETRLEGFTVRGGNAIGGGGMYCVASSPTVVDCVFTANYAQIGGAVRSEGFGGPRFEGCLFTSNEALTNTAGINSTGGPIQVLNCTFAANSAGAASALIVGTKSVGARIINCRFVENTASYLGTAVDGGDGVWANCVFWHNVSASPDPATLITAGGTAVINCTFYGDTGRAVDGNAGPPVSVYNCVVWGNALGSIRGAASAVYSDIQGGFLGEGNIDADPIFVQPGSGDLRLALGSPCLDAGSNAALPPDVLDLDGDGDTAEPIPVDLAGGPRVLNGIVDMGAYEGQFEPGAPAASDGDLDEGDFVVLIPEGGPLNPLASPAVILTNVSGGDNGSATVTQIDGSIHPGAGGYSDAGSVLVLETSLADGHFLSTVLVPFDSSALGGAAPQQVRATWYDGAAGNWALGVWGNANDSPGFTGPIGERIYAEAPGGWGVTQDTGDHGVYWDPAAGQGFAWANVDHASDFGVGISPCPGDCLQTPDGQVSVVDLLRLLSDWGTSAGGSCDVDSDGVIGTVDLAALLGTWGSCPVQAMKAPGLADLDASGAVDRTDLEMLMSCWGASEGACAADLDGDGSVGVRDYLHMLAHWDPADAAP